MIASLILAAATENPIQEISRTFGFNSHHFVAQCISFLLVSALLYKFAYKRILQTLEKRRQAIAEGLANAEKIKAELARTEARHHEVMAEANARIDKMFEEARAAAARVQSEETKKAVASAEQIVTKAREAAAADYARMLVDLKREVGRLVVQTTATVTGKVLTSEDQKRLAEEARHQLAA
jgi:F-type H+-transporting ATPase subunit b